MEYEWDRLQKQQRDIQARRDEFAEAELRLKHEEMLDAMSMQERARYEHNKKFRASLPKIPSRLSVNPCGIGG